MASADDCFACLAVLLEDGQAEGIAAELVLESTKRTRFERGALGSSVRKRIRTARLGIMGILAILGAGQWCVAASPGGGCVD